ncbi:OLC1v1036627C1 [Oldenlandia corymbosa var. corymbosa]|uniref:OLC1v1036627C1 n=1 Tax=Oldenlandia corymbosa var. corymbosa TaxID=529605 RepID=A0AAV1CZ03_OLDCO|nr:OLC1v1036627C1 [Oldenlandia corymbosa var. corymbosa]
MRDQLEEEEGDQQHHQQQHSSIQHTSSNPIAKLAFFSTFLVVTLLVIIYPPFDYSNDPRKIFESAPSLWYLNSTTSAHDEGKEANSSENCDLFTGDWVPDPDEPYYTNETCHKMYAFQNCLKNGRPDSGYLKWRWKPDGCELPKFDPDRFLELVRGKSMAFVGDSLARNHMQSLGCLLSKVAAHPEDVKAEEREEWVFKDYNFNISAYWSAFLTKTEKSEKGPGNIYLDEFNEYWTAKIENYDYMIISAGPWFFHTTMYYEKRRLFGCNNCKEENVPDIGFYSAYQKALRTSLRAMRELAKPGATFFVRSVSPIHFDGGPWDNGGHCNRTEPLKRKETSLDPYSAILRGIQMEEVEIAQKEGSKKGLSFRLIDVTSSMRLRPDGHPDVYCRGPNEKVAHDCLHWCLPGPIDVWNEFLLQLLIRDQDRRNSNDTV